MFKEDYQAAFSKVTASEETYRRVMQMTRKEKSRRSIGGTASKLLIAAVFISLLAVTASAVVKNWFVPFFSKEGELSQGQVQFIEQNEQYIGISQEQNGWTMELRSAISDGTKGYIMLGVTAPADVDLTRFLENEYYGPRNDFLPKSDDAALTCSAGLVADSGCSWEDDGDGLNNTLTYVIHVTPDPAFSTEDPFGRDVTWHIHFEDIVHGFPEQETIAEGTWDFDFSFEIDKSEMEFLTEPRKMQALGLTGESEVQADVTVNSIILRPFGATVYYGNDSDELDYSRANVNFTYFIEGEKPWEVVMKDGSRIPLTDRNGNPVERYRHLEADVPIVLENVDYILLADGTQLPVIASQAK